MFGKKLGDGFVWDSNVVNAERHFLIEIGRTFIHNGLHTGIAAGATIHHAFVVGAIPAHLKTFNAGSTGTPGYIAFTEGPTLSALGVLQAAHNKSRESTRQSASSVYLGPTVVATGTHMEGDFLIGGKQDGGSQQGNDDEWALAPNTTYLFSVTNNSNGIVDINFHLEWYDEIE